MPARFETPTGKWWGRFPAKAQSVMIVPASQTVAEADGQENATFLFLSRSGVHPDCERPAASPANAGGSHCVKAGSCMRGIPWPYAAL